MTEGKSVPKGFEICQNIVLYNMTYMMIYEKMWLKRAKAQPNTYFEMIPFDRCLLVPIEKHADHTWF